MGSREGVGRVPSPATGRWRSHAAVTEATENTEQGRPGFEIFKKIVDVQDFWNLYTPGFISVLSVASVTAAMENISHLFAGWNPRPKPGGTPTFFCFSP
jgi:hypothetical protein